MKDKKKVETVRVWAWEIKTDNGWRLCLWSHPSKAVLLNNQKPSPEARPICVSMVRNKDWSKL